MAGTETEQPGDGALRALAFAAVSSGVLVTDPSRPDNPVVEANPAFAAITGYGRAEVLGRNCRFLQGPDTDPGAVARVRDAVAEGRSVAETLLNYRKDGTPFWNELRVTPVRDADGRPTHFVGVLTDATARVEAEAALRASEERYRLIVERATDYAIFTTDADNRIDSWPPGAAAVFGWSAAEAVGMPAAETYTPEDRAAGVPEREFAAARRDGRAPNVRWHARKDGERVFVEGEAYARRGPGGAFLGVLKVGRDATERRRAEQALRASEERFRTLIQRSADAVQLIDPDGTILYSSDSVAAVLGYRPEEIAGRSLAPYVHPDDLPGVLEWIAGVAAEPGGAAGREYRVRHKDGSWAWVETTIANHLGTPSVRALVGNFRNVTARKALERQRDEFVAVATHELRTPVTSIKGYAQLLRNRFRKQGDARAAAMLETLEAQADRLQALVADLVDAARADAGQLRLDFAPFDLDALIDEQVAELRLTTDRHALRREGRAGATTVGDRHRVGQVLANLLSNAIKYSPDGGDVVVSATADGEAATVCVRDRGMGIPAGELDRVFERFYRGDRGHAAAPAGMGLGLSIAAEIVRRHGGRIWAESVEGEGSTFCVRLPLDPHAGAEAAS